MYSRVLLFGLITLAIAGMLSLSCALEKPVSPPPPPPPGPLPTEEGSEQPSEQIAPKPSEDEGELPEPGEAEEGQPSNTFADNQIASPFGACQVYWCQSTTEEEALCRHFALDAGIKWVRQDFVWQHIEPTKGSFDFSGYKLHFALQSLLDLQFAHQCTQ